MVLIYFTFIYRSLLMIIGCLKPVSKTDQFLLLNFLLFNYLCGMIAINNVLISNQVVEEQFVCDLNKCKGGCCIDGDAGAPLDESEKQKLEHVFDAVKPYLSAKHLKEIEKQGLYVYNDEFGLVTPAINGGICVYA